MERRYGPREPVNLDVTIYREKRKLGSFESRDIGLEGIFVAAQHPDLGVGECITLQLSLDVSDRDSCYPIRAIVVHRSNDGIGLMFTDYDPIFFLVLDTLSNPA